MMNYKEGLNKITTFIFDIDGVITNGDIILYNDEVIRTLNSRDGYALQYANKMGYNIFVITGGNAGEAKKRLLNVGAKEVILNSKNKVIDYNLLKEKYKFSDEEVVYMGDDIPDYKVMEIVGVSACPQDAAVEIKQLADYQSPYNGGRYCVRDIIEQTLRNQGKWFSKDAFEW